MCELDEIVANASKFNLKKRLPKLVTKFTRGQIFVPFNKDYNVAHALGSLARWPIAF